MFPSDDDEYGGCWTNLIGYPHGLFIGECNEPTICQHSNDGYNVKQVLPNTDSTCSFREGSASTTADFVGIEPHAQKIINENKKWNALHRK